MLEVLTSESRAATLRAKEDREIVENIERARAWLTGVGALTRFDDRAASLALMLDEAERRGREVEAKKHDNGVRFGGDEPDPGYGDWSG
jgi:hypothetical protein